ncbi:MAG: hypothetical protein JO029_07185 [Candidatus Eremiobacteraeota bacterium]|nr:hypothetical protein [Candidatus Eremiobacteraeota bacterium]
MATSARKKASELKVEAKPGSWSWLKEYTGYTVTVLPYVSAGLVLIPSLSVWIKGTILFIFAVVVLVIRVLHEKAGIEMTGKPERQKKP